MCHEIREVTLPAPLRLVEAGRIAEGAITLNIRHPVPGMPATLEIPADFDDPRTAGPLMLQQEEPVHLGCLTGRQDSPENWATGPQVYAYRNMLVGARVTTQTREEIVLRVKRFVLMRERAMAKLKHDVADLARRSPD